jgi:hypothetical protein
MLVFWVLTPCGLVGRYQYFDRTYFLHLQDWRRQYVSLKFWYVCTSPHGVITQMTNINITHMLLILECGGNELYWAIQNLWSQILCVLCTKYMKWMHTGEVMSIIPSHVSSPTLLNRFQYWSISVLESACKVIESISFWFMSVQFQPNFSWNSNQALQTFSNLTYHTI